MSDELQTSAAIPEHERAPSQTEEIDITDMKVALVVGVLPDGQFVFQTHGTNQGLVEYIGLHAYAGMKIQQLADEVVFRGDRITHEVGKAVGLLNKKIDELTAMLQLETPEEAAPSSENEE